MSQHSSGAIRIASIKDVVKGRSFCAKAGSKTLAVFKTSKGYAAIDNACPHAGGPLCEGSFAADVVTCPWHDSQFNVETGAVVHGPAETAVTSYPVEVRGEELFVRL